MPWEHAVVGYIGYSLFVHMLYRDSPTGGETVVVVFASVVPDIIDKPLAWEFGVFSSGYALGHSMFFAVPLSLAIGVLAYRRGQPRMGWAFGFGYLLHLPADVIPIYLLDGRFPIARILWPVQVYEGPHGHGLLEGFTENVMGYLHLFTEAPDSLYAMAVIGMMLFAVVLWIYDGMPVVHEGYQAIRRKT